MGRKCNVLNCPSDSRRIIDQGVTFHKIPHHTDLRPKWLELCRIPEERKNVKVIYVCSRHFLSADFCNFKGTKYMLRQGALPSVFPWSSPPNPLRKESDATANEIENGSDTYDTEPETSENTSEVKITPTKTSEGVKKSKKGETSAESSKKLTMPIDEDSFKIEEEMFNKSSQDGSTPNLLSQASLDCPGTIDFTPGTQIEANDFHDKWYPAKIVEVDYDEKEVFVHFEKCPNRGDEWIPMDSSRLRPLQPEKSVIFDTNERCLATWVDGKKFPATVKRVIDSETYEVLFDDGYVKTLKTNKLAKFQEDLLFKKVPLSKNALLFEPATGSKQERRDRKRKLNVAELFHKKRSRNDDGNSKIQTENTEEEKYNQEIISPQTEKFAGFSDQGEEEEWTCRWVNGDPIGEESTIVGMDGPRPSVIVPDNRLPPGWVKHLSKRVYGNSAGKWEVFIVNPEGRKFRNKHDIKIYLDETKQDLNIELFDFGLHLNRARKLGLYEVNNPEILAANTPKPVARNEGIRKSKEFIQKRSKIQKFGSPGPIIPADIAPIQSAGEETEEEETATGSLKIIHENDSYKCPIEGCGKNFRKENLAQMHIKHYHPEYTKLLGSTPNVADLAYARTVGNENFDENPSKQRLSLPNMETPKPKSTVRVLTPKTTKFDDFESKKIDKTPNLPKPAMKDAEIIRLLNSDPKSKGIDSIFEPSPTKSNEHHSKMESNCEIVKSEVKLPEKLQELLNKPDLINKKDEIAPTRPTGIKTILPVIRVQEEPKTDLNLSETNLDQSKSHLGPKTPGRPGRKRRPSDNESIKRRRQSLKYDTDEYSDYYENDNSISQDSFLNHSSAINVKPVETTILTDNPQVIIEGGEVIKLVHMKREEIINCTCGITEEDGLMIQCELCLCWQHAHCNNIAKESQVPEKYICYICQNPLKMRPTTKYLHDQDWLKQGTLATSDYHSKDEKVLNKRFEKLRKSHELTGNLLELNEFIHNLRIKLNIAETKDHPKLYLWAKQWEKTVPDLNLHLTKKDDLKDLSQVQESSQSSSNSDHSYIKGSMFGDVALQSMLAPPISEVKPTTITDDMKIKSQSELISILEDGETSEEKSQTNLTDEKISNESESDKKEDALNTITGGLLSSGSLDFQLSQTDLERLSNLAQLSEVGNPQIQPNIPQPEAAIDSGDCRMNLLDHIEYFQNLVNEKLNLIENEISALENEEPGSMNQDEPADSMPKTKQTIQMLIRDLGTMRQIASITQ